MKMFGSSVNPSAQPPILAWSGDLVPEHRLDLSSFILSNIVSQRPPYSPVSVPDDFQPSGIRTFESTPRGPAPKQTPVTRARTLDVGLKRTALEDLDEDEDDWTASVPPDMALKALEGFMPFQNIPAKHIAYRAFLTFCAGKADLKPSIDPSWITEFSQAAVIFKPLPPSMSARFTAASNAPNMALSAVAETQPSPPILVRQGRKISSWIPAELLCKHFGIEAPKKTSLVTPPAPNIQQPAAILNEDFCRPPKDLFAAVFGEDPTSTAKPTSKRPVASDFW